MECFVETSLIDKIIDPTILKLPILRYTKVVDGIAYQKMLHLVPIRKNKYDDIEYYALKEIDFIAVKNGSFPDFKKFKKLVIKKKGE